ncbi:hypothetical protein F5B20DRAFT_68405 [Whalleya microplaca]|nr:hypothetical protein F5B20DRAFT_68405 [Whalleya microplaca]
MLAIVALIALLLSLVEASLKTPRTASPILSPSASSNPSSTPTTASASFITISAPPRHGASSSALPPSGAEPPSATVEANIVVPSGTSEADGAAVTASPELDLGANFHEIGAKYVQTTYWSCVTFPLETHCGWHEPILDAGAARIGCDGGRAALRAGVAAGIVGGFMLGV